jgi:lipid II:glycine glycyltransferase (peptidoglycan interpeptide bridge formation enzyme)
MLQAVSRNDEQWNGFVLDNGGGFLQSWEWGRFQEESGRKVFRFRLDTEDGRTAAQFNVVFHRLPLAQQYAYVPMGPLVRRDGNGKSHFEACIAALSKSVGDSDAIFVRIEPKVLKEGDFVGAAEMERLGLRKVKAVQPADTVIADLTKSEEDLLAAMKQKTRYNVRLATKKGVTVRTANYENAHAFREDCDTFWRLLDETAERDKFHSHDKGYYEKMLDVLSPRKHGGLTVGLMFAEYEGEPVASVMLASFGDTVTYLHGASSSAHRNVMAPYLLHWRAMLEAKGRGFTKYDFWGVAPEGAKANHPWSGITRFKTGFGGDRVSYLGAWELPRSRFWYNLYRCAKRVRS